MVTQETTLNEELIRNHQSVKRPAEIGNDQTYSSNETSLESTMCPLPVVSTQSIHKTRLFKRPHMARLSFLSPKADTLKIEESPKNGESSVTTLANLPLDLDAEMCLHISISTYLENLKRFGHETAFNSFEMQQRPEPRARNSENAAPSPITLNIRARDLLFVKTLGRGAYGVVEQLRDSRSGFTLAAKRLTLTGNGPAHQALAGTALASERKRLLMDLRINAKSHCPFVVEFYGAMLSEGDVWICMEVMDCSLNEFYRAASKMNSKVEQDGVLEPVLPENVIRKVTLSVILALSYLRTELNVIHRDVKPSNVLLSRQPTSGGSVKMCDFGISGTLINSVAKTVDVGCQPYMAPERIDPQLVTTQVGYGYKSDVWSLGITLVEITTGKFPYPSWKTPFDQLKSVLQDPPPSLPDDMTVSRGYKDFLALCLTKDYANRPGYSELLDHPFLRGYQPGDLDINDYIDEVLKYTASEE